MTNIKSLFAQARDRLIVHGNITLALCFYWAYIHVLLYSGPFHRLPVFAPLPDWSVSLWTISLAGNVVTVLGLAIFCRRHDTVAFLDKGLKVGSAVVTVSTLCMVAGFFIPLPGLWISYGAGVVGTGVGLGFITAYLGYSLSSIPARDAFVCIALSTMGNTAVCFALSAMDDWLVYLLMGVFPFIVKKELQRAPELSSSDGAVETSIVDNSPKVTALPSFLKMLMALAFVVGFSLGIVHDITFDSQPWSLTRYYCLLLSVLLAGVLLFCSTRGYTKGNSVSLLFIGIVIVATSFLTFAFSSANITLTLIVNILGFYFFNALFWVLCTNYARQNNSPIWLFITAYAANQLGQFAGTLLGQAGLTTHVGNGPDFTLVASGGAYLILIIAIAILLKMQRRPPSVKTKTLSDLRQESCQRIAERYGLSPRETDVVELLAQGRDRAYIASELTISVETVKTHISRIYEKLDIHSRQELLTLLEGDLPE